VTDFRSLLSLWFMPIKKRRNKTLFCSVFMCEKIYACGIDTQRDRKRDDHVDRETYKHVDIKTDRQING